MAQRLYVYYKLAEPDLPATLTAVQRMQAALAGAHPGLHCEVLRRPEAPGGQVTLMECYAGPLTAALQRHIDAAAAGLPQPRHSERFDLLA